MILLAIPLIGQLVDCYPKKIHSNPQQTTGEKQARHIYLKVVPLKNDGVPLIK